MDRPRMLVYEGEFGYRDACVCMYKKLLKTYSPQRIECIGDKEPNELFLTTCTPQGKY